MATATPEDLDRVRKWWKTLPTQEQNITKFARENGLEANDVRRHLSGKKIYWYVHKKLAEYQSKEGVASSVLTNDQRLADNLTMIATATSTLTAVSKVTSTATATLAATATLTATTISEGKGEDMVSSALSSNRIAVEHKQKASKTPYEYGTLVCMVGGSHVGEVFRIFKKMGGPDRNQMYHIQNKDFACAKRLTARQHGQLCARQSAMRGVCAKCSLLVDSLRQCQRCSQTRLLLCIEGKDPQDYRDKILRAAQDFVERLCRLPAALGASSLDPLSSKIQSYMQNPVNWFGELLQFLSTQSKEFLQEPKQTLLTNAYHKLLVQFLKEPREALQSASDIHNFLRRRQELLTERWQKDAVPEARRKLEHDVMMMYKMLADNSETQFDKEVDIDRQYILAQTTITCHNNMIPLLKEFGDPGQLLKKILKFWGIFSDKVEFQDRCKDVILCNIIRQDINGVIIYGDWSYYLGKLLDIWAQQSKWTLLEPVLTELVSRRIYLVHQMFHVYQRYPGLSAKLIHGPQPSLKLV